MLYCNDQNSTVKITDGKSQGPSYDRVCISLWSLHAQDAFKRSTSKILLTAIFKLHTGPIIGPYIHIYICTTSAPLGDSPDPSKLMIFMIFGSFWVGGAIGKI